MAHAVGGNMFRQRGLATLPYTGQMDSSPFFERFSQITFLPSGNHSEPPWRKAYHTSD
jgi:hypothetical protein